jgi:hypothetical protein
MGKIVGFIVCMMLGLGLFVLASVKDVVLCSDGSGMCAISSKVFGYTISEDAFSIKDVDKIYCKKNYQPARSGKKTYFVLSLKKADGVEYNLGSFKTLGMCKNANSPLKNFISGKEKNIMYSSGTGISNIFGYIFAVLMLFIGIIILRSKPDEVEDDFSEE